MTTRATTTEADAAGLVEFRDTVCDADVQVVRDIVVSSGFFTPPEIDIAVELVEERLARGVASGYHFIFADADGHPIGYACYGPIGCTVGSFDLYWIAVRAAFRGHGLGRRLLREVERRVTRAGGRRLYVETSSRALYEPTRRFYERCGYHAEARLDDFYAPGDAKVIYVKPVDETGRREDCRDRDVEQQVK
jgi:D-alanine-D-alanine ligase